MKRVVVIAGPANSGKMPLARRLLAERPNLRLIHRDHLREHLFGPVSEAEITLLMRDLARGLIRYGYEPLIVAWNLMEDDRRLWQELADAYKCELEWLDVRDPAVAALVPPLETA